MSKEALLSLSHLKVATNTNDRVSKLRVRTYDAQYRSEVAALEAEFEKKFKLDALTKKVRAAKKKLREAEHALEDAKELAKKAARDKVAKIESKRTRALADESLRFEVSSLNLLGATLPEDVRKMIALEETTKLLTAGA